MRNLLMVAISLAALSAGAAMAATANEAVVARQSNYKQIGRAFKGIMDELKATAPSAPAIQANAAKLAALAPQVPSWFPAGTGPESGAKTSALPAIWQRNPEFKLAASNFAKAAAALNAAAGTGNIDQIRPAAQALGGTCRSCHESFRARD